MLMEKFAKALEIYSHQSGASEHEIEALRQKFQTIPEDYITLARAMTEIEFKVVPDGYLRIWRPSGCIEMFEAYNFEKYIPEGFPFGDNGGDKAFLFMRGPSSEQGVYMVPYGDIDRESSIFLSSTIDDIIYKGIGLNVILQNI